MSAILGTSGWPVLIVTFDFGTEERTWTDVGRLTVDRDGPNDEIRLELREPQPIGDGSHVVDNWSETAIGVEQVTIEPEAGEDVERQVVTLGTSTVPDRLDEIVA